MINFGLSCQDRSLILLLKNGRSSCIRICEVDLEMYFPRLFQIKPQDKKKHRQNKSYT